MNKRIEELMTQWSIESERHALSICGFCGHEDYNHLRNKKFAELIVRECADVLVTEMNRLDELNRVVAAQTLDTAQVLIKQHFGVE